MQPELLGPIATSDNALAMDERQKREQLYHVEFARQNKDKIETPVLLDVVEPGSRRPWNAYWSTYDLLLTENLRGKRVMIPGCGFGDDSIRLATLGADVYGSDLSPDLVEI